MAKFWFGPNRWPSCSEYAGPILALANHLRQVAAALYGKGSPGDADQSHRRQRAAFHINYRAPEVEEHLFWNAAHARYETRLIHCSTNLGFALIHQAMESVAQRLPVGTGAGARTTDARLGYALVPGRTAIGLNTVRIVAGSQHPVNVGDNREG